MGFHVLVTVSSVGSCDFDRLNSFLLVLCAAVEHGITVTRLLLESTDLLHSTVAMLTLQSLQQCTGVLPPLSSRVFYNQKKNGITSHLQKEPYFFHSVSSGGLNALPLFSFSQIV